MMRVLRWSLFSLLAASSVACTGKISGPAPAASGGNGTTSPGSGGSGGTSAVGTGGGAGSGGSGQTGGSGAAVDCSSGTHGAVAEARRLTSEEYSNAVKDLLGVDASSKYPGISGKSVTGYSTEPALSVIGEQGVAAVMNAAEDAALALAPNLAAVLPCTSKGDDACAGTFLDTVGRRAFRRQLTDDERTNLLAIYSAEKSDGATFSEAVAVMTSALLQMPAFLYVVEADVAAGKDRRRTGPELAQKLAFQLWGSVPDDALLDAADGGELDDESGVEAQAERMLADPRADRALARFFREWTETSAEDVASKDKTAFSYLDDDMIAAVNESFDRFVADQVHSGGTFQTLLRDNGAFVNDKLADFFGLDPVSTWTKVKLPADIYAGLVTQPAFMAAHAHTVSSSYVYRGRTIVKRFLCVDVGSPPATAMAAFNTLQLPADPTGKETAASVESRNDCGGCHKVIDPGGLAFEHFDGMGHYREQYDSGKAIDTTGALAGIDDTTLPFEGPVDLMDQLAELPAAEACFATQLFRYTAAEREGSEDACSIQTIGKALSGPDGTLAKAIIQTTQTDGFLYRRGE
jgi:hypothetical protein